MKKGKSLGVRSTVDKWPDFSNFIQMDSIYRLGFTYKDNSDCVMQNAKT